MLHWVLLSKRNFHLNTKLGINFWFSDLNHLISTHLSWKKAVDFPICNQITRIVQADFLTFRFIYLLQNNSTYNWPEPLLVNNMSTTNKNTLLFSRFCRTRSHRTARHRMDGRVLENQTWPPTLMGMDCNWTSDLSQLSNMC